MNNKNKEMLELMSQYVSKSDIYAANAIAKVSAFIYKYRKKAKMTQAKFAKMMGVSQSMVSKWESAEYNFTIENIAQISEKLNVVFEIEFAPETEYLANNSINKYSPIRKYGEWYLNNSSIAFSKYNESAA